MTMVRNMLVCVPINRLGLNASHAKPPTRREPFMRQVELIRQRVAKGLNGELVRLRIWMSGVEGNEQEVEKLRGKDCELILALLVEGLLKHLGHSATRYATAGPVVDSDERHSKARRIARQFTKSA